MPRAMNMEQEVITMLGGVAVVEEDKRMVRNCWMKKADAVVGWVEFECGGRKMNFVSFCILPLSIPWERITHKIKSHKSAEDPRKTTHFNFGFYDTSPPVVLNKYPTGQKHFSSRTLHQRPEDSLYFNFFLDNVLSALSSCYIVRCSENRRLWGLLVGLQTILTVLCVTCLIMNSVTSWSN